MLKRHSEAPIQGTSKPMTLKGALSQRKSLPLTLPITTDFRFQHSGRRHLGFLKIKNLTVYTNEASYSAFTDKI